MSMDDKHRITIVHKKNILDNEPKKLALLEEMKSITGSEWQFVLSPQLDAFIPRVLKVNNDRVKTVGDYLYGTEGYLYWIVEKFREACKDDLIREALLEATKGRKIVLTLRDEDTREKGIKFTDNFFHVYTTPKHFGYSVKHIAAEDLSTLL